jgi:arsenical pump membrane protein
MLYTIAVFALTLTLVMLRPKRVTEWMAAALGGLLMLIGGRVSLEDAAHTLAASWNVFGFFLGLMSISALADAAGFFEWAAFTAARQSGGSARRLFINVFLVGTVVTTFLSNDATALILTPIVFTLVSRLGLSPLPYLYACIFVADTASLTLPVSNPVNILMVDATDQGLVDYLSYLLLPSILAISLNLILFLYIFRNAISVPLDVERLPHPKQAVRNPAYFRFVIVSLVIIAIAYMIGSLLRGPLSVVAIGGALLLLAGGLASRQVSLGWLAKEISWGIFVFIAGMLLVVRGVENAGLTAALGRALLTAAGHDPVRAVFFNTFGAAIGSNLINNVPAMLVLISTLKSIPDLSVVMQQAIIYSTILGTGLGPNITIVGSLAKVLWVVILRRRGLEISPLQYFRTGIAVTPWLLLAGALAIWLRLLLR